MCRPAGEESHDERDADGGVPPATMLLRLERRFDDVVADPGAPSWCWTIVKTKRIVIGTIVAAALLQGDGRQRGQPTG